MQRRDFAVPFVRKSAFHSSKLLEGESYSIATTDSRVPELCIAVTIKVPTMAESITEGTLKSWSKQVGDSVSADEEIATIETDKVCSATSDPPATLSH